MVGTSNSRGQSIVAAGILLDSWRHLNSLKPDSLFPERFSFQEPKNMIMTETHPESDTMAKPTEKSAKKNVGYPRISVVIPALNEAKNLPHVLPRIPENVYEVLLVDGQSTDGTSEIARQIRPDIRIIEQKGKGKGAAL